ncbi:MAG: YVTN family beta-propeller repeat protein [Hyphomicrobiaceae bacterium]
MFGLLAALLVGAQLIMARSAEAYTVYVSNEKDNTVTVIDSETLKVTKTFKVGQRPRGITISKDGKWLLVCASDDDTVEVFDRKTLKLVKTLPSGPDPELFILHPSGNPLYIANEDDNLVTVVDIYKNKVLNEVPVGVEPEGMGISPDGKVLVNTSETTNMAHFIDTESYKITDNVLVDTRPRFAQFSADGSQLWVTSEIGGTVSVIDPATRKIIKKVTFAVPGVADEALQPVGVRLTKDGAKAFVALGPSNRVAIVNGKTFEVEKYLLVGQRVWQLGFTPDQKYLFSTNGVSNDVSVIDVASEKVIKSIPTGRFPWGVVVAKD